MNFSRRFTSILPQLIATTLPFISFQYWIYGKSFIFTVTNQYLPSSNSKTNINASEKMDSNQLTGNSRNSMSDYTNKLIINRLPPS
ncbi:MAG: hypothetical protein KBF82_01555 [Chitinophagaceae bacterium]|nr:hypothetical protein [Chitinophagaceae bacterium]